MKISVLIPCYNAGDYIAATLATVWKQDYPDLEVVVADGASTDGTLDVVRAYGDFVTQCVSEPDKGQLDALMKAAALATGDVCFWLNADDAVMPGAFQHVAEFFRRRPDTELLFGDDYGFDESKRALYVGSTIRGMSFDDHFLFYRQMYSECVYWRRELTPRVEPVDRSLRVYTDYSFFLPLRHGHVCRWTPKRLGAFRKVPGQMSAKHRERGEQERELIKARMRERLGMSDEAFAEAQRRHRISFRLRQQLYPRAHSAARYLWRRATGDRARRKMADYFFDDWLAPPPSIVAALASPPSPERGQDS